MTCQQHTTTQHPTFGVYFKNLQKTHPYAQFLFASNTGRDEPFLCNTQLASADIAPPPPEKGGEGLPVDDEVKVKSTKSPNSDQF